jgi:hypothetical protein
MMKTANDIADIVRRMVNIFCDWRVPCNECEYDFPCDMMHLALDMILRGEY